MEQVKITYYEAIAYLALFGVAVGILLGLIPLILGFLRKERSYALFGFFTSIIAGAFSPILSVIAVAVFTWLILRRPKNQTASAETPVDSDVSQIQEK